MRRDLIGQLLLTAVLLVALAVVIPPHRPPMICEDGVWASSFVHVGDGSDADPWVMGGVEFIHQPGRICFEPGYYTMDTGYVVVDIVGSVFDE